MVGFTRNDMEQKTGDAPFNFAQLYYIQLNDLIMKKNLLKANREWIGYCSVLRTILDQVYFKIYKESKYSEMEAKLVRAESLINSASDVKPELRGRAMGLVLSKIPSMLQEFDRELSVMMDRRKMIFPRVKTTYGVAELDKLYGLNQDG